MESPSIRRFSRCDSANSPEFEFWNLGRNPSPPTTTLHSADELFSDGFLLPLHLLPDYPSHTSHQQPTSEPDPEPGPSPDSDPATSASASITSSAGNPILTASKRWKEMFKRGEKKPEKSTEKTAEMNIKIWPFSRSRSSGNNSGRSRPAVLTNRKVSSAPCSRSNSSGESKTRRTWTGSPGRVGIHLGRSSPVWQVRRSRLGSDRGKAAGKGRVLNLNVPMCIGYRQHLSCRSDENGAVGGGGGGSRSSGGGSSGSNGNLFSLRGLFGKRSVLTV